MMDSVAQVLSDGMLDARLHIQHVRFDNFHTYTVIAENIIGISQKDVILQKSEFPNP